MVDNISLRNFENIVRDSFNPIVSSLLQFKLSPTKSWIKEGTQNIHDSEIKLGKIPIPVHVLTSILKLLIDIQLHESESFPSGKKNKLISIFIYMPVNIRPAANLSAGVISPTIHQSSIQYTLFKNQL